MLRFHVANMSCGGCAKGVTRAVQGVVANAKVEVDLASREVSVSGTSDSDGVIEALRRAGYQAENRGAQAG